MASNTDDTQQMSNNFLVGTFITHTNVKCMLYYVLFLCGTGQWPDCIPFVQCRHWFDTIGVCSAWTSCNFCSTVKFLFISTIFNFYLLRSTREVKWNLVVSLLFLVFFRQFWYVSKCYCFHLIFFPYEDLNQQPIRPQRAYLPENFEEYFTIVFNFYHLILNFSLLTMIFSMKRSQGSDSNEFPGSKPYVITMCMCGA